MVNLLFITCNHKIETIKNALQPLLKVKIDSVGDFDYGLKDVFEKRPTMVFIQDQIAGVTGESVARHIQMLLGASAPVFIFMHDGNAKAKPVKGLYEHLIDLSQDDSKVLEDIQSILASILGPQWHNVYIPPKPSRSAIMASMDMPVERRINADQLVDDFISDLGDAGFEPTAPVYPLSDFTLPDIAADEPFNFVSSQQDQLDEIVSESAKARQRIESEAGAARDDQTKKIFSPSDLTDLSAQVETPATSSDTPAPGVAKTAVVAEVSSTVSKSPLPAGGSVQAHPTPVIPGMPEKLQTPPISPAEFRIERQLRAVNSAHEEHLRAFEAKYLAKAAARKRYLTIAVVLLLCLMGVGWYLLQQAPHLLQSAAKESNPVIVPAPPTQSLAPLSPLAQKSVSTAQQPETDGLPSFIPRTGRDPSFASRKPGWERYVGSDSEYRVFSSGGKVKAVQVLATKGGVISESRLRSLLTELTGTGEYRIAAQEQKHGFQVSHATANRNTDVLIYRKDAAVHAFVVSLN